MMFEEEIYQEFKSRIAKLYDVEDEDISDIKDTVTIMIAQIIAQEDKIIALYKEAHEKGMDLKEAILWVAEQLE